MRIETVTSQLFFLCCRSSSWQLLNRRSPFGFEVLASAAELPQYELNLEETGIILKNSEDPIEVALTVTCSLLSSPSKSSSKTKKKIKGRGLDMTAVLTLTSDLEFIDFRRIPLVLDILRSHNPLIIRCRTKALKESKTFVVKAHLSKPSQSVVVSVASVRVQRVCLRSF